MNKTDVLEKIDEIFDLVKKKQDAELELDAVLLEIAKAQVKLRITKQAGKELKQKCRTQINELKDQIKFLGVRSKRVLDLLEKDEELQAKREAVDISKRKLDREIRGAVLHLKRIKNGIKEKEIEYEQLEAKIREKQNEIKSGNKI